MAKSKKNIKSPDLKKLWQDWRQEKFAVIKPLPGWLINILLVSGLLTILLGGYVYYQSTRIATEYEGLNQTARQVKLDVETVIRQMQSTLRSPMAIASGQDHLKKKITYRQLLKSLRDLDNNITDVRTFSRKVLTAPVESIASAIYPQQYVLYDMLLEAENTGIAPLQLLEDDGRKMVAGLIKIADKEGELGYLLISWKPDKLFEKVKVSSDINGFVSLQQAAGATYFTNIKAIGNAPERWVGAEHMPIRGSLFYLSWSKPPLPGIKSVKNALLVMLLGILVIVIAWLRKPSIDQREDVESLQADPDRPSIEVGTDLERQRELEEMAEFNRQQLGVDTPQLGTEPEPTGKTVSPSPISDLVELEHIPEVEVEHQRQKPEASIFKAYDIRGVVNKSLTADGAWYIGRAIGTLVNRKSAGPVVIARDGRVSGPALSKALKQGILSTGCDVIGIGMVPTGVLYFAAAELSSGTGVMVTGSHNPPEYNGLKMVIGGVTLATDKIQQLYTMIQNDDLDEGVGVSRSEGMLSRYQQVISDDIQLARPIKIVADCGNGVAGVNAVSVLQSIGAEVSALYDDVDGSFPNHHPDPSVPENLNDLIKAVQGTHADLGVAFDGDADRLGVVLPSGEIIYSDRLMILFVEDILSRNPGATIIYDVKCSRHLTTAIRNAGGVPLMWKTGHSFIKNKMPSMKAPFAGEMSGHFFFKERWYGVDDGIYAACRLLEILAWKNESPQQVLEALPTGVSTPEIKISMAEGESHDFIDTLQDHARFDNAQINTIDGLRVDFDDGWGLVRASNTTPILVARFDADNEEALHRIQNAFRDLLLSLRPDLQLPF